MIIFFDTDILLDIALNRKEFYEHSAAVINLIEQNKIEGYLAWHSLSNFYYLTAGSSGKNKSKQFIKDLLQFVKISDANTACAEYALKLDVPDFEDALQIAAAKECNAEFIITRNVKHYKKSPIKALTPKAFLKSYVFSA